MSSDEYFRKNGKRAEGFVSSVQSAHRKDVYGNTIRPEFIICYQFRDEQERIWRGKLSMRSRVCSMKEGDRVEVHYIPDKPHRNKAQIAYKQN